MSKASEELKKSLEEAEKALAIADKAAKAARGELGDEATDTVIGAVSDARAFAHIAEAARQKGEK